MERFLVGILNLVERSWPHLSSPQWSRSQSASTKVEYYFSRPWFKMSKENTVVDTSCASCGVAEIDDDIKLMPCDGCDLVRYCDDACRELHRPEHAGKCRKRAAELRDELLFKQPENSYLGDCPICCLPMLSRRQAITTTCCSKIVCMGCCYVNHIRENQNNCPFCRVPLPKTKEEDDKLRIKRVEANDPVAVCYEGMLQCKRGNYSSVFDYFTKAAELGNYEAHSELARMYHDGHGVEEDEKKIIHHLEEAAIGGHPGARHNLGCEEKKNGNIERAAKHWMIAAKQGEDNSMKKLMDAFREGNVSKEDLTATLRAHKAAADAINSPERKAAEEWYRMNEFDTL